MAKLHLDLNLRLASPWCECYGKIKAFFAKDDEISVVLDEEKHDVRIYVDSVMKAAALNELLKKEIKEKEATLCTVTVISPNDNAVANFMSDIEKIDQAFWGNPIMKRIEEARFPFGFTYVVFTPEVVRYYNDSLAEWDRCSSTLYQEIAKEIFEPQDGVFWTTDSTK